MRLTVQNPDDRRSLFRRSNARYNSFYLCRKSRSDKSVAMRSNPAQGEINLIIDILQNGCPSESAVWWARRRRGVPRRPSHPARTHPRPSAGTPRWTSMSARRRSTWTSRRSATRTTTRAPRARRGRRRPRRRRRSASRPRPCRIRRRSPATASACRRSSGRTHPPRTCRTRRRTGSPRPSAPIRRRPARRSCTRRCTSRAASCRPIRTTPSRTCTPSCCRIIFCRRTCTRCCAASIRLIPDYTRRTRRTGYTILIRSATSTAASSATRCSARRMDSRYMCAVGAHIFSSGPGCFDSFLICRSHPRSDSFIVATINSRAAIISIQATSFLFYLHNCKINILVLSKIMSSVTLLPREVILQVLVKENNLEFLIDKDISHLCRGPF